MKILVKDMAALRTATLLASCGEGYWLLAVLYLKKAYGRQK